MYRLRVPLSTRQKKSVYSQRKRRRLRSSEDVNENAYSRSKWGCIPDVKEGAYPRCMRGCIPPAEAWVTIGGGRRCSTSGLSCKPFRASGPPEGLARHNFPYVDSPASIDPLKTTEYVAQSGPHPASTSRESHTASTLSGPHPTSALSVG